MSKTRAEHSMRPGALEVLEGRALLATAAIVNPSGPISAITVGDDGSFQVRRSDFESGQAFPNTHDPADAGLFLRHPDGTVVGFDAYDRTATGYRTGAGPTLSHGLHPLMLTVSDDGRSVLLVGDNRGDGNVLGQYFQLTQLTTYQPGDDYFRVDNTILNLGAVPLLLDVFAAADLYLADQDLGVGYWDPDTGAVGGTDLSGGYTVFVQPNLAGALAPTGFQGGHFQAIWRAIGEGNHLNNSVPLPGGNPPWTRDNLAFTDNGAALEWEGVSVAPGASARISYFWSFGGSQEILPDPPPVVTGNTIAATSGESFDTVVGTFTASGSPVSAGDFVATVHWGDGGLLELAGVRPGAGFNTFEVVGAHSYLAPGEFVVTVTVTGPGGGVGAGLGKAIVTGDEIPPPGGGATMIAGDLARESDRGMSNQDRITNENRPRFHGTATPNSQWTIVATAIDGLGTSATLGAITADAGGAWSLTVSNPVADGRYTVEARPVVAGTGIGPSVLIDGARPLVIDTVGPRVTALLVLPKRGELRLVFRDEGSGVAGGNLPELALYRLTDRVKGKVQKIALRVAGVQANAAGSPQAGIALATLSKKLKASMRYLFSAESLILDVAGNGLSGRYSGKFASGDVAGTPSQFLVNIQTTQKKLIALKAVGANAKKKS